MSGGSAGEEAVVARKVANARTKAGPASQRGWWGSSASTQLVWGALRAAPRPAVPRDTVVKNAERPCSTSTVHFEPSYSPQNHKRQGHPAIPPFRLGDLHVMHGESENAHSRVHVHVRYAPTSSRARIRVPQRATPADRGSGRPAVDTACETRARVSSWAPKRVGWTSKLQAWKSYCASASS